MDRKAILITVGVGVGAAAVGGAIYALLKDQDLSLTAGGGRSHEISRPSCIEVKIPASEAGVVIGRGGENIRDIQRKTNTKIHFKDESELYININLP